MIKAIKKFFGLKTTNYTQLVKEGAIILDVRTVGEFSTGHIKGAVNIPLDKLSNNLDKLKAKHKPIITCCASGMRSASAKGILLTKGYDKVYNGGAWHRLNLKLNN